MAFRYKRRSDEAVEKRATQQGGNFEGFVKDEYRLYTPKKGDYSVRFLPRDESENAEHYGEDVYVHYSVGPDRATVLCPAKMVNEACPLCEERARAERRSDEEALKELAPHRRVLTWVLDRKNEDQGPLLWAMPWTVDRDINKACKDRETGRYYFVDDPEQGYDVYFDVDGEGIQKKYNGYQLQKRPSSVAKKWLDYIEKNPLLDTLHWRDYDEILRLYEGVSAEPRKDEEVRETRRSEPEPRVSSRGESEEREPPPWKEDEARASNGHDREADDNRRPEPEAAPAREERRSIARREPSPPSEPASASTVSISGKSRAEQLRERFAARK